LEPGTNFPNLRGFERAHGRVTTLAPGATRRLSFEMAIHPDKTAVQAVADEVQQLQNSMTLAVHRHPLPEFSPAGK